MLDKTRLKTFIYTYGQSVQPGGISAPTELSNLELWLKWDTSTMWQNTGKTTAVSSGDDPVRVWEDQSGNGNDAIAAADGERPLYQTDGLTFDGTDDVLRGSFTNYGGTDLTWFIVFEYVAFGEAGDGLLSLTETGIATGADGATPNFIAASFLNATTFRYVANNVGGGEQTIATGTAYYVSGLADATNIATWLNGGSKDEAADSITFEFDDYTLGARYFGGGVQRESNVKVKEVIIYTEAKSQADIDAVEAYLASTHGI